MVEIKRLLALIAFFFARLNALDVHENIDKEIARATREITSKSNKTLSPFMDDHSRKIIVDHLKYVTPLVIKNQTLELEKELNGQKGPKDARSKKMLAIKYAKNSTDTIKEELAKFSSKSGNTKGGVSKRSELSIAAAAALAGAAEIITVMGSATIVIIAFILLWNLIAFFTRILGFIFPGPGLGSYFGFGGYPYGIGNGYGPY